MEADDNGHKTNENKEQQEEEHGRIEVVISSVDVELVASIDKIVGQVSSFCSERCIYKVPEPLRSVKPEAYTPTLISIGPIHSAKTDLMANSHKPRFLKNFLEVTKLTSQDAIERVKTWEARARNCYAEPIEMGSGELVKLLLLDGCFVVMNLIHFKFQPEIKNHGDSQPSLLSSDLSNSLRLLDEISNDLLLLENQLPFFLLEELYSLCASSRRFLQNLTFTELVRFYFIDSYKEGLDFLRREDQANSVVNEPKANHFVDFLRIQYAHSCSSSKRYDNRRSFPRTFWPPTATELHQCGVSFTTTEKEEKKCAVDVTFKDRDGYLELPKIIIYDGFETRVRNLIAYEQCHGSSNMRYEVSNMAVFLQYLVQTNQDVRLLIDHEIIENNLGSVNEVTQLFNSLCKHVSSGTNFYNSECKRMKEYCKRRRHRWITSLRRNYFSTPLACASSIAAVLLLSLTLLQAVASVVALRK